MKVSSERREGTFKEQPFQFYHNEDVAGSILRESLAHYV